VNQISVGLCTEARLCHLEERRNWNSRLLAYESEFIVGYAYGSVMKPNVVCLTTSRAHIQSLYKPARHYTGCSAAVLRVNTQHIYPSQPLGPIHLPNGHLLGQDFIQTWSPLRMDVLPAFVDVRLDHHTSEIPVAGA
jgi:hypothetical protein